MADAEHVHVPPSPGVLFRRNGPAVGALAALCVVVLVAVVGYPWLPDDSPNATRQQLSLARLPAGSTVTLASVPLNPAVPEVGPFDYWWGGQPTRTKEWPIAVGTDSAKVQRKKEWVRFEPLGAAPVLIEGPAAARMQVIQRAFPLGTDSFGRCLYSRLVLGARLTLSVGAIAVLLSVAIGTLLGAIAGYWGGWIDAALQGLMTVLWALPALLLAIAIAFALGKGLSQLIWAVALSQWVEVARLVRGEVRSLKERPYVEAARVMGLSDARLLWVHILPGLTSPLIIVAVANFATAILLESGLSFLGLGVPPPTPSWGAMVNEGYPYLLLALGQGLALWPGLALMLTILCLYVVGQGLRDALDPRSR
jgi:ABC-type dipeptide/oligopeptide/nickel transport system permease subunit